ncbi:protein of unknown function [Methylorubrum extorquens]|uniref:Uncharacterized protein n=1 Tax=Methylorubrum extorquens TaxID=408 RepID=A0A2N9AHI3_METEX|nr:protein of unknown function [Methylorubrum extorquens]
MVSPPPVSFSERLPSLPATLVARWNGLPFAVPLRKPGSGQRRRPEAQVLGRELLLRRLARPQSGDREAPDAQVVDDDVAAQRLRFARQQQRFVGDRQGKPGALDRGLDEADLAFEQGGQRDLRIDRLRVEGRPVLGAEPEAREAKVRRGQQAQVDGALAAGTGSEGVAQRAVDQRAMSRPVDERRHRKGRHENQHDGARERGQGITHRYRFRLACGPQDFVRVSHAFEGPMPFERRETRVPAAIAQAAAGPHLTLKLSPSVSGGCRRTARPAAER